MGRNRTVFHSFRNRQSVQSQKECYSVEINYLSEYYQCFVNKSVINLKHLVSTSLSRKNYLKIYGVAGDIAIFLFHNFFFEHGVGFRPERHFSENQCFASKCSTFHNFSRIAYLHIDFAT